MLLPLPKNLQIEDMTGTLRITRRWFSPVFLFLIFFSIVWNTILAAYYSGILMAFNPLQEDFTMKPEILAALLFPILHVLVGLGLLYYTVCGIINRTEISVSREYLDVRHYPLPWPGKKKISVFDIRQLYCEKHVGSKGSVSYTVNVITKNFTKQKIVSGLSMSDQAVYIEKKIEEYLRIQDEPVQGEYNPD